MAPSLPGEFEASIRSQLGDLFSDFQDSLQESSPVSIRTHPVKKNQITTESSVPWCRFGKYLPSRPVFTHDPFFHAGAYYVQEASSMFIEQALMQWVNLDQSLKILDLCAAPGGKSTHILSLINRDSLLVANDTIRARANILSENIQKWGYPNAVVTNNDPADFTKLSGFFDVIVVDAPCSGEGLFRKDPEAMKEWSPANVALCANRQKRILADVWEALGENGILLYSTCTYNKLENEENLNWLQQNHAVEFLKIQADPSWGVEEVLEGKVVGYRFFPHKVRGEGFFLSAIRKAEATESTNVRRISIATPSASVQERLQQWIRNPAGNKFYQFNDLLFYTPASLAPEFEFLLQPLKIIYAGTNVASIKHDKLIPEHALALSVEINREHFPALEVSEADALKFLRKESIQVPGAKTGFALVTFEDVPLGWANILSNRINNMYPAQWRIRM